MQPKRTFGWFAFCSRVACQHTAVGGVKQTMYFMLHVSHDARVATVFKQLCGCILVARCHKSIAIVVVALSSWLVELLARLFTYPVWLSGYKAYFTLGSQEPWDNKSKGAT